MKVLFIPGITAEMFRSGCLESIEALMSEGEIYDIEYEPKWIPTSERLPEISGVYLVTDMRERWGEKSIPYTTIAEYSPYKKYKWGVNGGRTNTVTAWMPLPDCYEEEQK